MAYIKPVILSIIIFSIGFILANYFNNAPYVGKHVTFYATEGYLNLEAWGVLELTNTEKADYLSQLFQISSIDGLPGKIVLSEGLGNSGTITFTRPVLLDIVSMDESHVIAKNDIWTITIQDDQNENSNQDIHVLIVTKA